MVYVLYFSKGTIVITYFEWVLIVLYCQMLKSIVQMHYTLVADEKRAFLKGEEVKNLFMLRLTRKESRKMFCVCRRLEVYSVQ